MKQRLIQRQRLDVRLTPQMHQFLKVIQMPIQELSAYVEMELQENPLLEEIVPNDEGRDRLNAAEDMDKYFEEDLYTPIKEQYYEVQQRSPIPIKAEENWREGLYRDISTLFDSEEDVRIARFIIFNLSDNGFLTMTPSNLAEMLGVSQDHIERVLDVIKKNCMPGIGARDVKECLLLQIERCEGRDSVVYRIVESAFADLIRRRYRKIARIMRVPLKQVLFTAQSLRRYYTSPIIDRGDMCCVYPEYEVKIVDGNIQIEKLSWHMPKLRLNQAYIRLLRSQPNKETREFLQNYLRRAKDLLHALDERHRKMMDLLEFLTIRQRGFVENGYSFLRPLTLKDASDYTGMSESTISRLANNKYVQLPWGCVRLKEFFLNPLSYTNDTPKAMILELIKEIISSSDRRLSDEAIRKKLLQQGIQISRRTVNKYRNELKKSQRLDS